MTKTNYEIKQGTIDKVLEMLKKAKSLTNLNKGFLRSEIIDSASTSNYLSPAIQLSYINKVEGNRYVCALANPEPFHARKVAELCNSRQEAYKSGTIAKIRLTKNDIINELKASLQSAWETGRPIVFPLTVAKHTGLRLAYSKAFCIMGLASTRGDDFNRIFACVGKADDQEWKVLKDLVKTINSVGKFSTKIGIISSLVKKHTLLTEAELFNLISKIENSSKTRSLEKEKQIQYQSHVDPTKDDNANPKPQEKFIGIGEEPAVKKNDKNEVPEYIKLAKILAREPWLEKYLAK